MKKKIIGQLILASSVLLAGAAKAQSSSAINQAERSQRFQEIQAPKLKLETGGTAPELYSGEGEDVGPQHLLKLKPSRTWFEAAVDSQAYWTDNANLAGSGGEKKSLVFINTIQAALAPGGFSFNEHLLYPSLGFRAQWYNYTSKSLAGTDLDFHNEVAFASLRYDFAENWRAFLGVDAGRLLNQSHYREFYREVAPNWGAQYLWKLSSNKLISFDYHGYYHISSTITAPTVLTIITPSSISTVTAVTPRDFNNRTDHNLTVSYSQELCPGLVLQPFYRFQFTHYTGFNSGNDYLHDAGVNLSYYFNRWASVRTFFLYETKDSGTVFPDYTQINGGLGAMLDIQF